MSFGSFKVLRDNAYVEPGKVLVEVVVLVVVTARTVCVVITVGFCVIVVVTVGAGSWQVIYAIAGFSRE